MIRGPLELAKLDRYIKANPGIGLRWSAVGLPRREMTIKSPARPRSGGASIYSGAGDRSRTYDLRITNALLYQLSYTGKEPGL